MLNTLRDSTIFIPMNNAVTVSHTAEPRRKASFFTDNLITSK